jgi:hypothetical protein
MPYSHSPLTLREVFVSSTVRDLSEYRAAVQDVLLRHVEVAAHLSEDWSGGFDDTVVKCRERLMYADAYFGIFGYWYGSVPPNHNESITHLEFLWAMERWGNATAPPIAVFMPEGKADKVLRRKAEELFLLDYAHLSDADRKVVRERIDCQIAAFHAAVRNPGGKWRTVNPFKDESELRERAMVTCFRWQQKTQPQLCGRTPSEEELGRLGRDAQTVEAKRVLSKVTAHPDVPAVALLVTGGEDSGQRELCSHLLALPQFRRGRRPGRGRPSTERYELPAFIAWCAQALGLAPPASEVSIETISELALRIHRALQQQQLTLVVDQIERFPGRVVGFYERFFKPLYTALRAEGRAANRLVVVVADYTGLNEPWEGCSCASASDISEINYELLVQLPTLTDFGPEDVQEWLDNVDVLDEPYGRCDELVNFALSTPGGTFDGTPRRVFGRLCSTTLWPDKVE